MHVTEGVDGLGEQARQLEAGLIPARPFLILGQYASFDGSRAPDGGEAAWAYTHVPQEVRGAAGRDELTGQWSDSGSARFADRMEERSNAWPLGSRSRSSPVTCSRRSRWRHRTPIWSEAR